MRSIDSSQLIPPWGSKPAWREANRCIDSLTRRYSVKLASARALSVLLRRKFESLFSLLDDLCLETCSRCPDPCCLYASPWYEFRDLVFLHLNTLEIPFAQTIKALNETCRFAGPRGCILDRISRPWICTWYLCSVQTANLNSRRPARRKNLTTVINEIKALRNEMEEAFIRVII